MVTICVAINLCALPRYTMAYDIHLDTQSHYLYVNLNIMFDQPTTDTVTLEMPVWAPGYYMIMDFPKNVSDFKATTDGTTPLTWTKTSKNQWAITQQGRQLQVSYRVYANEHSVAESRVDNRSAFIAPNGVFMYVKDDKEHRVTTTYHMPSGWSKASTGLKPVGANEGTERTFVAPDFDTLFDSPLLLGNHFTTYFSHEGHDYEFAIETPDGFSESGIIDDFKRMVSATTRLIGHVPYDNYCVIHLGAGGGGLEHLNSQACYTSGSYRFASHDDYLRHLAFVTHEYFHLYNVKSIRPFELGPFDYSRECYTPLLWVSEGFTCYYECRLLMQAGIVDGDYLLREISSSIRTIEESEGHHHMSLRQSSYDIWLNFFNHSENVISYYDKGPILGLLFDIELRRLTNCQRGLDDLMRLLYNRYYLDLRRGFTEAEFWQAAAEVAGEELTTLRRYVDTTDDIDYDSILTPAGLALDRNTWSLYIINNKVSKEQQKLRKEIIGK